ncbi:PREDICTED: uncharacterized protein LOC105571036, partial [Vollenhovia emeryi]|uniref:uncharacterized protein LOC105571036 n=1 Tax=Vollenhovia emeryi TaxID=411798 RepID=UPI0005F48472
TVQQLQEVAPQLRDLCMAGGFPLAKWHATHLDILKTVTDSQDQGLPITFDDCATKILGLKWLPQEDTFAFSPRNSRTEDRLTKRLVLSEVAQILDPLGFASPVVIKAKILLQELWLHKLQWDDPLTSQLSTRWLIRREELIGLAKLSIPRWFNTWSTSSVGLQGFSDASQLAMTAVVYISVHDSTGSTFSLVCSKTKVAPIKRLSIPRLELTAALLLSRLMQYVKATLNMDVMATHLWTESLVTLSWVRSHASRWKDFVRNRVAQIEELTPAAHWRYIPGTSNPADCASRGLTTAQLQNRSLWWTGPPWILNPDSWPSQLALSEELSATEAHPGVSLLTVTPRTDYQWELIYKYSSLTKLLRITALCFRFVSRLRKVHDSLPVRHISPETLEKARLFWIQAAQATYFSHELKALQADSPLAKAHAFNRLTAYIGAQGVIRVGRRLAHAALSLDAKHPAILPRYSQLSSLIIAHAHQWTLHGGTQLTHPTTVLDSRRMGSCQFSHPATRPFTHTGVDYAGPLTVKTWKGRGAKTTKGWIYVFVCFSTSAVHLEAVSDYSSERFIAAYRRFSSRRGIAHTSQSNCGTNFIDADTALKRLFIQSTQNHQRISQLLSQDNTRWEFNLPATPHRGGKWEAVVKPKEVLSPPYQSHHSLTWPSQDSHDGNSSSTRHHRNNEIKIGSLVLITDERLPPCKWPLARITALHPGKDGPVRVVTLKTATTTLIRPVIKLSVLPISS